MITGPSLGSEHLLSCTLVILLAGAMIAVSAPVVAASESPVILWTEQFGTPAEEEAGGAGGVAVGLGGIFVTGMTRGALPGQTNAGANDVFLRKYDRNGNELWTREFGTPDEDLVESLATDATDLYVVGDTQGVLPGQSAAGSWDAYIRKYDSDGNELWTRQFGTSGTDGANGVAVSGADVYVTGWFHAPSDDVFVSKYSANGTSLWTRQFGTPTEDYGNSVAADATGVYVAGRTSGALPGQTSAGTSDAFVRKYDPNGSELWTRQFGTSGIDWAHGIQIAPLGVLVAGTTRGALPGQTSAGGYDAFLRAYDSVGGELWTRQFGTAGGERGDDVAVDASGAYVIGTTWGAFPGHASAGDADVFVRTYDFSGTEGWTLQFGSSGVEVGSSIAVDAPNVYVFGQTNGTFPGQANAGDTDAFLVKLGPKAAAVPCPLSQGYWKNHPNAWPAGSLVLGSETYGRTDLLALLRMPPRGDASLILAHQLIAAKLNVANGTDPEPVRSTLADGDAALAAIPGKLPHGTKPSSDAGRKMTAAADVLDAYNNGQFTPDCGKPADDGGSSSTGRFDGEGADRGQAGGQAASSLLAGGAWLLASLATLAASAAVAAAPVRRHLRERGK